MRSTMLCMLWAYLRCASMADVLSLSCCVADGGPRMVCSKEESSSEERSVDPRNKVDNVVY